MSNLKYKHTAYTSAQWASLNPVIVENEIVIESDTKRTKIGNGISTYNELEYADANSVGNSLGSIKPTDAAPTPARNGNYTFSIGGAKPAWLTAEAGVTTVKAGDGVAVVYNSVGGTYTYTHVNISTEIVQITGQEINKVMSQKAVTDNINFAKTKSFGVNTNTKIAEIATTQMNFGTNDFTLEWAGIIKSGLTYQGILSSENINTGFYLFINNSKIECGLLNTFFVITETITLDNFYHIVMVRAGMEVILYLNGIEEKRGTSNDLKNVVCNTFEIGERAGNYPSNSSYCLVRVYDKAISSDEVNIIYNYNNPLNYRLNKSLYENCVFEILPHNFYVDKIIDTAKNQNNIYSATAYEYINYNLLPLQDSRFISLESRTNRLENVTYGVKLDGIVKFSKLNSPLFIFGTNDFTLEWAGKLLPGNQGILGTGVTIGGNGFGQTAYFAIDSALKRFEFGHSGLLSNYFNIEWNTFYHIVAIRNGLITKLIINGEVVSTVNQTSLGIVGTNGDFWLGSRHDSYLTPQNGESYLYRLFNRALTSDEAIEISTFDVNENINDDLYNSCLLEILPKNLRFDSVIDSSLYLHKVIILNNGAGNVRENPTQISFSKNLEDDILANTEMIAEVQDRVDNIEQLTLQNTSAVAQNASEIINAKNKADEAISTSNSTNEALQQTNSELLILETAINELSSPLPSGLVSGNNVWAGTNIFTNSPIIPDAIENNKPVAYGQIKKTLNRTINAADYGFLPTASASDNVLALQDALYGGNKTIEVTLPGIYELNSNVYIDDNTTIIFKNGIKLKKVANYQFVLINRGALTRTYNSNIQIYGLKIIVNDMAQTAFSAGLNSPTWGLLGHLSFFYIRDLIIKDFECLDTNDNQYNIHICTFERIRLENIKVFGAKDGIHLGNGKYFIIKNVWGKTIDDLLAFNAHDWVNAQPEQGDITDGVCENIYDFDDGTVAGYTARFLVGAWIDWHSGMSVQNGDTVRNNGNLYRVYMPTPDMYTDGAIATNYTSNTAPTNLSGSIILDGITWIFNQAGGGLSAEVKRVTIKNLFLYKSRASGFYHSNSAVDRAIYPESTYKPMCDGIVIENINDSAPLGRLFGISCGAKIELSKIKTNRKIAYISESPDKWLRIFDYDMTDESALEDIVVNPNSPLNLELWNCIQDRDFILFAYNHATNVVRVNGNASINTVANLKPRIGDEIKVVGVPKIFTGTEWKSLI